MRKMLKHAILTAFLLGSVSPPLQAAQRGGMVQIVSLGEPQVLNPVFDQSPAATEFYNLIFSGLLKANSQAELEPDLVVNVPTVANGGVVFGKKGDMQVKYRLRPGLKWQDGHPLTAEDVLFTWQAHTDPRIKYPSTSGYEAVKHVDIISPEEFVVHFHRPYGDYYKLFNYLLPKHSFRSQHWAFAPDHPYNRHPVGSGPFVLKQWEKGKGAILDANPLYYRAKPMLDQIRFRFEPDNFRTIKEVLNWVDQAEVLSGMSLASYEYLKNRPDLELHVVPTGQIEHLLFNLNHPVLADRRVRRALAYATDRQAISDLLLGLAEPAYSDRLKDAWQYNPNTEQFYSPSLDQARANLEAAGWQQPRNAELRSKNQQPLSLVLTLAQGNKSHEVVGRYLQASWKKIGVDLKLKFVKPEIMTREYIPAGDYELAFGTWNSVSAETPYKRWHSTQKPPLGLNYSHFSDYQMDELTRELQSTVNLQQQARLYHQIAALLAEQLPALPLYHGAVLEANKKALHNYQPNIHMGTTWNANSWWLDS